MKNLETYNLKTLSLQETMEISGGGLLAEEQSLVGKLQRQIKELQARISELEEELDAEIV